MKRRTLLEFPRKLELRARAPVEREMVEDSIEGEAEGSLAMINAAVQVAGDMNKWYDALSGEPLNVDEDPEDLIEAESLIESLDAQRQVHLRVI